MTVGKRICNKEWCYIALFWIGNIILWFTLYWKLCVANIGADYFLHDKYVSLLLDGEMVLMYPGYHFLVALFAVAFGMRTTVAAVVVLTIAMCASIYVTTIILRDSLEIDFLSGIQLLYISFLLNIVQPIFFYGYAPGYSSGNGYISPTQVACKPVALLAIWFFLKMNESDHIKIKDQLMLLVILILTCLMKPLFAIAFIPAIGCWYLLRVKEEYPKISKICILQFLKYIWPMIVCGFFLIIQYIYGIVYNGNHEEVLSIGNETHVRIGFLHAWGMVVDNVAISILFAYFFPITMIILVLYGKKRLCNSRATQNLIHYLKQRKSYIDLCIIYAGISLMLISFLYQDNGCESHMNFRNSWILTFSFVYCFAMAILLYMFKEKGWKSTDVRIGILSFGVHVLFGIVLIIKNYVV